MDTIGYIGGIILALCGLPEAYLAYKNKDSNLSWYFLGMWGIGEILILIPILIKYNIGFLIINYILNILFISIIVYYKWKRRDYEKRR